MDIEQSGANDHDAKERSNRTHKVLRRPSQHVFEARSFVVGTAAACLAAQVCLHVDAQRLELQVGPHIFSHIEPQDSEILPGSVAPGLRAAASKFCKARLSTLLVPVEQCAASVGSMATLELFKIRDSSRKMEEQDSIEEGTVSIVCDESCPTIATSSVLFNCMIPISFKRSMDIMGYMDYLPDDTPDTATERMRRELNDMYEETIISEGRLKKLVGHDVELAAKLCAPGGKNCKFGNELKKIQCFRGSRSALLNKEWWTELGKEFGLGITGTIARSDVIRLSTQRMEHIRNAIMKSGYARIPADELGLNKGKEMPAALINRLQGMIEKLHRLKLPPACILLYDDPWRMFHSSMQGFMTELLGGGSVAVRDIGASMWAITQASNATPEESLYTSNVGHAPHRDGGDHLGPPSREALGELSGWVPLTDHEPPGPTLYFVPKYLDPMVTLPGSPSPVENFEDPAPQRPHDLLFSKKIVFDVRSIRAVPAKAGDLVLWEGAVYHWVSPSDQEQGLHSRVVSSFYSEEAFPPERRNNRSRPLRKFPKFPWNSRLALLCGQLFVHMRHHPAFFDFIGKHFKACPKREKDGTQWDPVRNFPHHKRMYEQMKQG